jgi:hypothetical protein
MGYLTPDTVPTSFRCRRLRIPDDVDWLSIVNGAIYELTKPYNYEAFGDLTEQETAEVFETMFGEYLQGEACLIGSVLLYATATAPDGTLPCDGSSHLRVDFPSLYAVIDSAYIVDADHFITPNPVGLVGLNYRIVSR